MHAEKIQGRGWEWRRYACLRFQRDRRAYAPMLTPVTRSSARIEAWRISARGVFSAHLEKPRGCLESAAGCWEGAVKGVIGNDGPA
jgi:hypothetical protein